jgi:hypothetical protein
MKSSIQRLLIRLIASFAIAFALFTQGQVAKAQVFYMCDTSNQANACAGEAPGGTNYGSSAGPWSVGDSWYFALYTYPYAPIDACDQNGCTSGGAMGTADANGDFVLYGTFTSDVVGNWWETWYAGPYPSYPTNTIYFSVTDNGSSGGGGTNPPPACGITIEPQPPSVIFASATYNFNANNGGGIYYYLPTDESSTPSYVQASTQSGCTLTASAGSGDGSGPFATTSSGQNTANIYYGADASVYAYTPPPGIQPDGCQAIGAYYLTLGFTAKGAGFSTSTASVSFELDVSGCFNNF